MNPRHAYMQQKGQARRRGIGWNISFDDWWAVWVASGHWNERGRNWNNYVMCRVGDVGAYEVGNVFIALGVRNASEAHRKRTGLPMGVYLTMGKYFQAKRSRDGKRYYLGTFSSAEDAHAACLRFDQRHECLKAHADDVGEAA